MPHDEPRKESACGFPTAKSGYPILSLHGNGVGFGPGYRHHKPAGVAADALKAPPHGERNMTDERKPTTDEAMGIVWWNGLTEQDRARWMQAAGNTGVAADAWAAFKKGADPTNDKPCHGQ